MEDIITKTKTKIQPIFARHETFHPRFGWLKKGFDKAIENSAIFSEESASTALGVGKNMVNAIRYQERLGINGYGPERSLYSTFVV